MIVNINEIKDQTTQDKILDFEKRGGSFQIGVYQIEKNNEGFIPTDEYYLHLIVARQTLDKLNYDMNFHWNRCIEKNGRSRFPVMTTDYDKLDSSGEKIDLEIFLGTHFDFSQHKPLIRGKLSNETRNLYFHPDAIETVENGVWLQQSPEQIKFIKRHPNTPDGFVYSFLHAPYGGRFGTTIKEVGDYLLDFMNYFLGPLNELQIYAWSTDCSPYFDSGKEWWGCFFWTVYNPSKQWYVGLIASETD